MESSQTTAHHLTDKAPGVSELTNEQLLARRLTAFEMFTIKRMTKAEIAEKLGVSAHTIGVDIKAVMKYKHENAVEIAQNVKAKQDNIYEALITKWLPIALGDLPQGEDGEGLNVEDRIALIQAGAQATATITSVLRDQAKLHGFHVPKPPDMKETGKAIGEGVFSAMQRIAGAKVVQAQVVTEQIEDKREGQEADAPKG